MLLIPLQAVPNQTVSVLLSNQSVRLNVYLRGANLFMDVFQGVDDAAVIVGVICENKNRIIRDLYFGFQGDFAFYDTQAEADPEYTGLGSRYQLIYIEPSELPEGVG